MSQEDEGRLAFCVPNLHQAIHTRAGQLSRWRVDQGANAAWVSRRQSARLRLLGEVPELDRSVLAAAGQGAAVGRHRQGTNRTLVALERRQLLARVGVPPFDKVIVTAAGQLLAVLAEDDRVDAAFMPLERLLILAA